MGAVFLLAGNHGRNHAGSYGCDRLVYEREIASRHCAVKIPVVRTPQEDLGSGQFGQLLVRVIINLFLAARFDRPICPAFPKEHVENPQGSLRPEHRLRNFLPL